MSAGAEVTATRELSAETREARRSETIRDLQQCAADYGQDYLSGAEYLRWRDEQRGQRVGQPFPPSLPTIATRFGSFLAALDTAGLKPRPRPQTLAEITWLDEPTGLQPDAELAVAYAFSHFLGTRRGDRKSLYEFNRLLAGLAGVEGPGRDGGWPSGTSVLKRLGLTGLDLDNQWALVETTTRLLSPRILRAFLPPRIWPQAFRLIEAGPLDAWEAARSLLKAWAIGIEPSGEPRRHVGTNSTLADGALAETAIAAKYWVLFGFFNSLDKMRVAEKGDKLELPDERRFFAQWIKADFPPKPRADEFNAAPAETIREAASLRLVRLVLQILCEEIDLLKKTAAGRQRLFQPLRDRAIIATLAITGLRRRAFTALAIGDVQEHYVFPGNEVGSAIVPRPGKTLSSRMKRPKGIPPLLFDWIKEYADYAGTWGEEDAPLWLPNTAPDRSRRKAMDNDSIYSAVRARFTPKLRGAGKAPETRPLQRAFIEEHDGRSYGPHNLRHTAEQLGFCAGYDWFDAHRSTMLEEGGGMPANPQIFPDCLLDHAMSGMGDLYKDISSERGRLKWARLCALGIGEYIFGEKGARRAPDLPLIRDKQRALEDAAARRGEVEAKLQAIADDIANRQEVLAEKEILLAIFQDLQLTRTLGALGEAVERARHELAEAQKAEIAVPDYLSRAELNDLRQHRDPAIDDDQNDEELPVLRDWAWLHEFHWALGGHATISLETLRRWARGERTRLGRALGLPNGIAGVNDGRPLCVERLSDRKQRVKLRELDWSRLPLPVQENLQAIQRTTWGLDMAATSVPRAE